MPKVRIESVGVVWPKASMVRHSSVAYAVRAAKRCLKNSHHRRSDIGAFINVGTYRDGHYAEPAIATFMQKKLGINIEFQGKQTLSFDLQNGGVGFLNALSVLNQMLVAGHVHAGMVIASEGNSDRRPDPAYTYPRSGAAMIVDLSPLKESGFGAFHFSQFPEGYDLYESVVSLDRPHGHLHMRVDRPKLEALYLKKAGLFFRELLAKENLLPNDIQLVIPAQLSPSFVGQLSSALEIDKDRVFDVTHQLSDTLTTSLPLAWSAAQQTGQLTPGSKIALLSFGSGITLGGAVYYC